MTATNLLTNPTFLSGSSGWTTDSPLADGTRSYTFSTDADGKGKLTTYGTGVGSLCQTLTVSPGDKLFISFRAMTDADTTVRFGIYIPASGTYRHVSDTGHSSPLSTYFNGPLTWYGGEVVVPAGVTSVKVFLAFPAGRTWVRELNCFTSPNLVTDGDFSTNTDGTTGGDGGAPSTWTLDWHQLSGSAGGWTTEGGALKHNGGAATSGCASNAFAVSAGERLYLSAEGWGSITAGCRVGIWYGTTSTFTQAAAIDHLYLADGEDFQADRKKYAAFVTVPASATYARVVVYNLAAGTCYWDRVRARRASSLGVTEALRPEVLVEMAFGIASEHLVTDRYSWQVGSVSDANLVGSSFLSPWSGSAVDAATFTDVSALTMRLEARRGKSSKTGEYDTGSATLILDNADRRFDPLNLSGPYVVDGVAYIGRGRMIRLSLVDPETSEPFPFFTGRTTSWKPQYSANGNGRVTVQAVELTADLTRPIAVTAFSSQRSDLFVDAVLDEQGWPSSWRDLDTGTVTVPAVTEGGDMLPWLRSAALTELGALYLDGAGKVRFRVGTNHRASNVQAYIDQTDDSAIRLDFEDAPRIKYDNDDFTNYVSGMRYGGVAGTDEQVAQNAPSIANTGARPFTATNLLFGTNAEVLTWAEAKLADGLAADLAYVEAIDVAPVVSPEWWAILMWAEFGDLFDVTVEPPPDGSDTINQQLQYEALAVTGGNIADEGIKATLGFFPA